MVDAGFGGQSKVWSGRAAEPQHSVTRRAPQPL
jgi:hypothetical protein